MRVAIVALLLVGCTPSNPTASGPGGPATSVKPAPSPSEPGAPKPAPSPSEAGAPKPAPSPSEAGAPKLAPPPASSPAVRPVQRHFDALVGKPCPTASVGPEMCVLCTQHDEVFGVVLPGDFVAMSGDVDLLRRSPPEPPGEVPRKLQFFVAVSEDTLRAQVLTCPGCRRQLGWAVVATLRGLRDASPELRADVQAALGWQRAPLLDGATAWRAAPAGEVLRMGPACPGGVRR